MKLISRVLMVVLSVGLSTSAFAQGGKAKELNKKLSALEQQERTLLSQKATLAHDAKMSRRALGLAVVTSPLAFYSQYNLNKVWLVGAGASWAKYSVDRRKLDSTTNDLSQLRRQIVQREDLLATQRVDKPNAPAAPTFAETAQTNTLRAQMAWH